MQLIGPRSVLDPWHQAGRIFGPDAEIAGTYSYSTCENACVDVGPLGAEKKRKGKKKGADEDGTKTLQY